MNDRTAKVSGPSEMVSVTDDPNAVFVASLGSTEMTCPRGMSLEYSVWTTGSNPADDNACSAACWRLPITAGTRPGAWALLTPRAAGQPLGALASGGDRPGGHPSPRPPPLTCPAWPRGQPLPWGAAGAPP